LGLDAKRADIFFRWQWTNFNMAAVTNYIEFQIDFYLSEWIKICPSDYPCPCDYPK
jgi:hypothetical protein